MYAIRSYYAKQDLQQRFGRLSGLLVAEMNSQGFWPGELSSSALGVAVALAALHFHDREGHAREIGLALDWLINNVNDDGSFGDSPGSPGNVSASLLVYAAVNLYVITSYSIHYTKLYDTFNVYGRPRSTCLGCPRSTFMGRPRSSIRAPT